MIKKTIKWLLIIVIGIPLLVSIYITATETDGEAVDRINAYIKNTEDPERIYNYRKDIFKLTPEDLEAKKLLETAKNSYREEILSNLKDNNKENTYKKLVELYPDNIEYKNKLESAISSRKLVEKQKELAKEKAQKEKDLEFQTIYMAKKSIKSILKDADSAKFRDVIFVNKSIPVACGEVNSKNSFGAFAGFTKFVSTGTPDLTVLQSQVDDFHKVWNKFCAGE